MSENKHLRFLSSSIAQEKKQEKKKQKQKIIW